MLAPDVQQASPALAALAPRPVSIAQTGLSVPLLVDLASKHFVAAGVLTPSQLVERLCLAGPIVEQVIQAMRAEALVETRMRLVNESELRYGLTDRGRQHALDAAARNGYVGPAPVPLPDYSRMVTEQSRMGVRVTRAGLRHAFRDVVIADDMLDRLGPALNSGRSIFLYGDPGTGKTFIAQRLTRALRGRVLIPHAIAVDECAIRVFDAKVHAAVGAPRGEGGLMLEHGYDPRFVLCELPLVVVGGEMTRDMLEVSFDPGLREYVAPLQLKANGGLFLIDDLGRQRVTPAEIFNRWIVPLEEHRDYLSLAGGRHFSVPFDVRLVFSTNFDPTVLADDAFLRRIGYKIELLPVTPEQYVEIWRQLCVQRGVSFDPALVDYVVNELHLTSGTPLLPCHPRDLLNMSLDHSSYFGDAAVLTLDGVRSAWESYFVRTRNSPPGDAYPAQTEI